MMNMMGYGVRAAVLTLVLLLASISAAAQDDQPGWTIRQLTECRRGQSGFPQVSENGTTVFFISNCDLTDNNFDHSSEIFQWEADRPGEESSNDKITQLTDTRNCRIADLALAPNGAGLAFSSDCRFDPDARGREFQISVMTGPGQIVPVTKGVVYGSVRPAWSPNSRSLVFESTADLVAANPDHNPEIFLADLAQSNSVEIKQLSFTRAPGGCESPQMTSSSVIARCNTDLPGTGDAASTIKVFTADGQATYGNPDRNFELYSLDLAGPVTQLTTSRNCQNEPASVNATGTMAAFSSDCGYVRTAIQFRKNNLYLLTPAIVPVFADFSFNCAALALSADNSTIALSSNYSTIGNNPGHGRQIFTLAIPSISPENPGAPLQLPAEAMVQITNFDRGNAENPAISRDGKVIVFVSTADPNGDNGDGNPEIFIAVKSE